MSYHKLIDNTLYKEAAGVVVRCACGWVSGGHVSSMAASAAFREHKDKAENTKEND